MSKMGVSTIASYTGAQIFEAIGLGDEVIATCFEGTSSRLGGVGFDVLAEEAARRAAVGRGGPGLAHRQLETGGEYQWRREGEPHLFNPQTVFKLQHATRSRRYEIFKEYTALVDDQAAKLATLRGLLRIKGIDDGQVEPGTVRKIDLDEVESVSSIVKRFATGAMSYGSISAEAHETLAIAMNRLGARSNTGEGGEDADRFSPDPNGDLRRSAVKQVASGRFGVTSEYLVNADDLQIKMAQGAKPGEGGQLPGHKVYPWIAGTRYSTPGVGLISPPPHHDIYSIEDLAQLIHDLKNANPAARVHVKLVAEVGVGTVAAGVSKAHADVVLISGHDGGTGAAPLTSLKHTGAPWELGLAETQQTLLRNRLRDRITVQVDGQLKTGRDVIIAALLGAEEFGFASAPLVVSGCIMMRVCHLDTCPVGVATQNPELRKRFSGKPEFVVTFFEYIAEEVREYLAALGLRSLEEAVGRVDLLDTARAVSHWKAAGLDLAPVLHAPEQDGPLHQTIGQDHGLDRALDNTLIQLAEGALEEARPVRLELPIRNVNRTVGTMLGYEVTRRWGGEGLPPDTIAVAFTGSAGQSFGAFLPRGITLRLTGDANDYLGKGLSGGRLIVAPAADSPFDAETQVVAGNVIGYGATSGEIFLRGKVGERFCVRNSGALAVAEGVGDHGCEYMTGGRVVVLGRTGRNFAAGMSGGIAYVLDLNPIRLNREMVDVDPLDDADAEFLREVLLRHQAETGSTVAAGLLASWELGRGPVRQGHAQGLQAGPRGGVGRRARGPGRQRGRHGRGSWLAPMRGVTGGRSPRGRRSEEYLVMGDPKGFLKTARETPRRRPVDVRLTDWREVYEPFAAERAERQAARCMDCGIPFCHQGCPLGNLIPEWNDLVYRSDWAAAADRLHATNNFPEFTGRLCPAPCEAACVLGINAEPVTIKQVEVEIIDRAWADGGVLPLPPQALTGHSVAVVGSGPGRAGRGPAADQGRAPGDGLRGRRPARRPAAVRHPRVQDGEAPPGPAARPDDGRGHPVLVRGPGHVGGAARRVLGRGAGGRRAGGARPADARPRAGRHPPGDGVPAAGEPARPRLADQRRGQARGDPRRRRHRRGLPRHGAAAGRAVGDAAGDHAQAAEDAGAAPAVADLPDDLPGGVRPRGGRRAGLRRLHRGVRGRRGRPGPGAGADRGGLRDRPLHGGRGHSQGDPVRAGAAGDGLHRRREARAALRSRGGVRPARQRRPRRRVPDVGPRRVRGRRHGPRPVADRLGDRRGPQRRRLGRPVPGRPRPPAPPGRHPADGAPARR